MYGNDTLPGLAVSPTYRNTGSIWLGAPAATWFKTVSVNGTIEAGSIVKELTDGSYAPIEDTDIASNVSSLPGSRLAIVADNTSDTAEQPAESEDTDDQPATEISSSTVLVGVCGKVDKAKLLIGSKHFTELTDAQQIGLNLQLEAWGFLLLNVTQA